MDAKCLLRAIDAVAVGGGHSSQGDKPTSTPKSDKAHIWNPPVDNIMALAGGGQFLCYGAGGFRSLM